MGELSKKVSSGAISSLEAKMAYVSYIKIRNTSLDFATEQALNTVQDKSEKKILDFVNSSEFEKMSEQEKKEWIIKHVNIPGIK